MLICYCPLLPETFIVQWLNDHWASIGNCLLPFAYWSLPILIFTAMRYPLILILLFPVLSYSQVSSEADALFIKNTYRKCYSEELGYKWLTTLTKEIGHRLTGSPQAAKAVEWAKNVLDTCGLDKVWLQEVVVPHWVRGDKEQLTMLSKDFGSVSMNTIALGNSPGTGIDGVRGQVIEVKSLEQLKAMPEDEVKGKIVFFNRPMDNGLINTFAAYGGAGDQRGSGPVAAAEKGAIAAVVRSLCPRHDDYPHTGATRLSQTIKNIPSVAVSTNDAEKLSKSISLGATEVFIRTTCEMLDSVISYNVIGEITGSVSPDTIILVGGHLDSWDVGEGAHDDGAGVVHSIETLYRLAHSDYKPRHTIRCVLFMNEENGLRGGHKYAQEAIINNEFHLVAIETDAGGATPQSFGCSMGADTLLDEHVSYMKTFMKVMEPYSIRLEPGGGGADIGPLKTKAGLLIGLRPDSARYFEYHHADTDVLENVHPRELESGAAAITSFIYLIDQYGIGK
ncbi:MAG TPA: M28 family peptidase [Saprospiraceae bacterium]|nr:M28 family peptidase [Saprospiraceae bacterium]